MGMNVVVESHLGEFKEALETQIEQALIAIGLTAETYAKDGCPVDTGRLRNSITHENDSRSVVIGTNVEYGKYVELGTSRMKAANGGTGFLRPAADGHSEEYRQIVEDAMKS